MLCAVHHFNLHVTQYTHTSPKTCYPQTKTQLYYEKEDLAIKLALFDFLLEVSRSL